MVGLTAIAAKEQAIDNKSYDDGLRRDDELQPRHDGRGMSSSTDDKEVVVSQ